MVCRKVVISNKLGLHARPASNFVKEASKFKSDIKIMYGEKVCIAKSLISVLTACIKCGSEIEICCNGEDENEAMEALVAAIESGLGE